MSSIQAKLESALQKRWTIVLVLAGSLLVVLAAVNFASWFFVSRIETDLDEALGLRLKSVASLVANIVEGEILETAQFADAAGAGEYDWQGQSVLLRITLDEIRSDNEIQAIYLVDTTYATLVAVPETAFRFGDVIPYLAEDSTRIAGAVSGIPGASSLHDIHGNKFKSGYAAVRYPLTGDIAALVVVEASATFLRVLATWQRAQWIVMALSLLIIVAYGWFAYFVISRVLALQEQTRHNERLAAMGRMAATVAHEVRNPLGIIKSTAEVLKGMYAETGEKSELFDFIPSEVDRLNRLVSDFLMFARDRALELEDADLVETVEKAIHDTGEQGDSQGVRIVVDAPDAGVRIRHSPDAIRQVMLNLVRNASEAIKGSGEIRIAVSGAAGGARGPAQIVVQDSGPGFQDPEARLFEPFFTTKTSGSGLGLAVTLQIVEKHRGSVIARNRPEGGAEVVIRLPG